MKRYAGFGGDDYYPAGGWDDFEGTADSPEEALALAQRDAMWAHVIDLQTGERIRDTYRTGYGTDAEWREAERPTSSV